MRLHDYPSRPAHLKWLLDSDPAIRWQVLRDLTGEAPARLQPSGPASQPKAGDDNISPWNPLPATWAGAPAGWRDDLSKEARGLLVTLYTLVVLKNLGLDPAS